MQTPAVSRLLGIDPGLGITGYAVLEIASLQTTLAAPRVREAGVIRGSDDRKSGSLPSRLASLYGGIVEVLEQFSPSAVAVEQLFAHYEHPRTAILMGHARGVLLLAAGQRQLPVFSYTAPRIKKTITGHGRASKDQVQRTVQRELRLAQLPEPPDVADALAVALCHYYTLRMPTRGTG